MKTQKIKQYAFVDAVDFDCFEIKLNERLEELAECDPEVEFYETDTTLARIKYVKQKEFTPATPAEAGIKFTCGDCPMFGHIMKKDGSPDLRRTYGNCDIGEMGRVWKTTPACDYLYKRIKDGRVRLTLEDD